MAAYEFVTSLESLESLESSCEMLMWSYKAWKAAVRSQKLMPDKILLILSARTRRGIMIRNNQIHYSRPLFPLIIPLIYFTDAYAASKVGNSKPPLCSMPPSSIRSGRTNSQTLVDIGRQDPAADSMRPPAGGIEAAVAAWEKKNARRTGY